MTKKKKHKCYWCGKGFRYLPFRWTDTETDAVYKVCSTQCRSFVADFFSRIPGPWPEGLAAAVIITVAVGLVAGSIVYWAGRLFN